MELSHTAVCKELLLDLLCYEMHCGRLSPEMEYLLKMHLEECQHCRHRVFAFQKMLREPVVERNYG
jgi:DNA-directed RNA polymerase subunit RPC12/RpoP